jgi:HlyD family secretion protein
MAAALLALAMLSGCQRPAATGWSGYVEGDYVYIAAPVAGTLVTLSVQAGQTVAAGAPLFTLDATSNQAARAEADARVRAAQAQADNAAKGRRNEEIAVIRAQLSQARALAQRAQADWERQQALVAQEFVSQSRLDDATAARKQARTAWRARGQPAGRQPAGARGRARQRRRRRRSRLSASCGANSGRCKPRQPPGWSATPSGAPAVRPASRCSPAAAGPGAPLLRVEGELGGLALGQAVSLHCDGCGADRAHITRIAREYTPPVIY